MRSNKMKCDAFIHQTGISVVAVDLDDTLVRSDWTVSERTLRLLDEWEARRGPVVIATGRPPRWTRKIPDALHRHPWICYNGAVAHEDGKVIYRNLVPAATARHVIAQFQDKDPTCWLGLEIEDQLYINRPNERPDAIYVENLLDIADQPVAKVLFRVEENAEIPDYLALLPESVRALVSTKVPLVQVMARSASKGTALAALVARWDRSLAEVVAFGDDVNDVEMVQECGLGVAMSNAVPEVKAVADCVTGSNDEDGVAVVLEQLLQI
jgi:Cof subfamily protein (haloacid dehalogenase superfamily)